METDGKAIVRYRDGRVERGFVDTIDAGAAEVHVRDDSGSSRAIAFGEIKAVFFPARDEAVAAASGSVLSVEFADGESIRGTASYNPASNGFFLFPEDRSKTDCLFVVTSAITSIEIEKL